MNFNSSPIRFDAAATIIGLGGFLLWDRFIYKAGYKMWSGGLLFSSCGTLGALILAGVIAFRLFKTSPRPVESTMIRLALLSVVLIYFVSKVRGDDIFLRGFRDRFAATVNPQALQDWAMEIINRESADDRIASIPQDRLPKELKELERPPGILLRRDSRGKFIELNYGRRWGLHIGTPAFRLRPHHDCIEWIPGVYFFVAVSA